ncbi:hypothetical protein [Limnobacter sp.]|uniref:hypothetical protein n=1 Tax=Limnobacter sp. TaxID=2003368 RepID=UPI002735E520|nr:hypothetical protein [Limnobacter sp.]
MFPAHINHSFYTPPNSIASSSGLSFIPGSISVGSSLFNSVHRALAADLFNQSASSGSLVAIPSPERFEHLLDSSLGSFSLLGTLDGMQINPPAGGRGPENNIPASIQIGRFRKPTRLMEPIPVLNTQSEGERRNQLRSELLNWVSATESGLEENERRDTALQIIGCFHSQAPTLTIAAENITDLPDCIGLLWHLRTLDLSNCRSLKSLPNVLNNFVNLLDLKLINCSNLKALPPTVTALRGFACVFLNGSGVDLANPLQSRLGTARNFGR